MFCSFRSLTDCNIFHYLSLFRMDTDTFDQLLSKISPIVQKANTNMRSAITAEEKLAITLRFLARGNSYHSLMYEFRVSMTSISRLVPEVCDAICQVLGTSLKAPTHTQEWLEIARGFEEKWQFPHCLGAIDGKHIHIKAPPNSGSQYYNYKSRFSIVLLAIADASYKFIAYDLGSPGSSSDGGIFKDGTLSALLRRPSFQKLLKLANDRIKFRIYY